MKKRPLPCNNKELQARIDEHVNSAVYILARTHADQIAALEKQHKAALTSHRIEALRELTKFLSVAGQTMQTVQRAMESEAGQL